MKFKTNYVIATTLLALVGLPSTTLAAKGGNGGGKDKPGQSEPGQIISVDLEFDDIHSGTASNPGTGEDNVLLSDTGSIYSDNVDGLIDVGENFNIVLDPEGPDRTFKFPSDLPVVDDYGALQSDADGGGYPMPFVGTKKVKGQVMSALVEGDDGGPVLATHLAGEVELIFRGSNHDDSPVGCVRHVGARLRLVDDNGDGWGVYFGSGESPGDFTESPGGSCIVVTRMPNTPGTVEEPDGHAVWQFHTEAPHTGYLYFDNRPPHHETELHGTITLPFSGTLTSILSEPVPDSSNSCTQGCE